MKQLFTIGLTILSFLISFSQEEETKTTIDTPKSIKDQFEFIYKKSNNYSQFKVVKRDWILKLKKQTLDSLKNIEAELNNAESKILAQQQTISKVEKDLEGINKQLEFVTNEKDTMPFLGMETTKKSYSGIVWSIVGVLLTLLGFFIFKFKQSNVITKEAQKGLKDLEEEFEDHRRRALEREQKVMRRLQDELNKSKK